MAIVFAELFLFRGDKTGDEPEVEIELQFVSEKSKGFDLPLFAIFGFKNSHGFYNTKIFYADFFGWSNWLIKVV